MFTRVDRDILRSLADQYMQAANLPVQKEKINLWKSLNRSKMQRPMVVIDQLPWHELQCEELIPQVSDPFWRMQEERLRQTLYMWNHFPVDMVLDPFITIPKAINYGGYGLGINVKYMGAENSNAKSQHFTNQINSMDDVKKITDYHVSLNKEMNDVIFDEADAIFKDIAPVKAGGCQINFGLWDYLSMLMSVEEAYYALIDQPDLIHAAMERLTESFLCYIDDANKFGLHSDIENRCHCSYIYTDELLPDSGQSKGPYSKNCWNFGLAQLFTSISPKMFAEFEIPYASRIAQHYGMVYYGCCDRMDDRLEYVKKIPNVRKISCSPWSDRKKFSENIGTSLIMSNKPTPAFLAGGSMNEDIIREDLTYTCELAKSNNLSLELVLKDVSTVENKPERLTRWAEIAMEVVNNY